MKITELDTILCSIGVVASFRNLGSKIELNGNKCNLLENYLNDLEKIIKVLYNGGNLDTELTDKQEDLLHRILKNEIGR